MSFGYEILAMLKDKDHQTLSFHFSILKWAFYWILNFRAGNFKTAEYFVAKTLAHSLYNILKTSWKNGSFSNTFKVIFKQVKMTNL